MGRNTDSDDTETSSKGGAKDYIFTGLDTGKPSVKSCNLK
jgi:hypothetical protein